MSELEPQVPPQHTVPDAVFVPPPEAEPEEHPFWNYQDLLLFAALSIPSLLFGFLLVLGFFLASGWRPEAKAALLLPAQFLGYAFWFFALYMLLKMRYGRPFWQSLAWVMPPRDRHMWLSLFAGPLVALAIAVLGALLRTPEIDMPIREYLNDRLSIAMLFLFATTLGPLCEELAFRGFFLPLVMRSLGPVAGVFVAALPFALLHGPQYGWSGRHVLLILLAGAAFGWTRYRTGSTAAAAVMHASYNLTFFTGFLVQGKHITW